MVQDACYQIGLKYAQLKLAWCYENGFGVGQNEQKAIKWYAKAAHQGEKKAQCSLGRLLKKDGDFEGAVKWFSRAAEEGFPDAEYELGLCYAEGKGVDEKKTEAVELWAKAAENGNADAQYQLALSLLSEWVCARARQKPRRGC